MTNHTFNRTQSSQLNAGPSQPSYGVFRPNNGPRAQGPGNVPPLYAAPGPTSPQPSQSPPQPPPQPPRLPRPIIHTPQKRTSQSTCLMIVLLQVLCALIVYRSNSLSSYVQLEIGARRASREASALVAEREKLEVERENMRHDREIWERVPKEPVPPGASWTSVRPVYECRAYGKREYSGALEYIPPGWSVFDACMNTPVRINRVTIKQPHRCGFESGSSHIHGYWMVDWGQDDCKPKHEGVRDVVSQSIPLSPHL